MNLSHRNVGSDASTPFPPARDFLGPAHADTRDMSSAMVESSYAPVPRRLLVHCTSFDDARPSAYRKVQARRSPREGENGHTYHQFRGSYAVAFDGRVERLTFVLQDRREYQLLCRRSAAGDDAPCAELLRSFETH